MVEIEEVTDEVPPSEERLLDAQEIESLLNKIKRPTARMQLEALAKKLRKDASALKRLEASNALNDTAIVEDVTNQATPASPRVPAPPPVHTAPSIRTGAQYVTIDKFSFDAGSYNSPTVSIYVSLEGVKKIPRANIICDFTPFSFDLIVKDLDGKSYRLFKDSLAHDIDPETSKVVVKVDRLIVKLSKVKGEYGYDTWTDLFDKKKSPTRGADGKRKNEDPSSSIMNLMKDMYQSGDDNMRKIIGETMEKQRRGELGKDANTGMGNMGM